jgi:acyl dehydratase
MESTTRTLHSPPATLPLYLRALRRRSSAADATLPDTEWRRLDARTDLDHLGAYCRLTGHRLASTLPGLYPHLAAFALQLAVLTDRRFPFPALGLVHVGNRVTQVRPIGVDEAFDVAVRAERRRPHRSGTVVDVATTATVAGVVVWEETTTVLSRGTRHPDVSDTSPLSGLTAPTGSIRWQVPRDTGRRFAAVSGDRNPIHLSAVTARPFGSLAQSRTACGRRLGRWQRSSRPCPTATGTRWPSDGRCSCRRLCTSARPARLALTPAPAGCWASPRPTARRRTWSLGSVPPPGTSPDRGNGQRLGRPNGSWVTDACRRSANAAAVGRQVPRSSTPSRFQSPVTGNDPIAPKST